MFSAAKNTGFYLYRFIFWKDGKILSALIDKVQPCQQDFPLTDGHG